MGILSKVNARRYESEWKEVDRERFTQEDNDVIKEAKVVASQYGKSVKLLYNDGTMEFYGLSRDCDLPVDTIVEPLKCFMVFLERGDQKTNKIYVEE